MCINVAGWFSLLIGSVLVSISCTYMFYLFPMIAKKQDTSISISALKLCSMLGLGGLIFLFLGILYLMQIIP
jgi:hypothetical protein